MIERYGGQPSVRLVMKAEVDLVDSLCGSDVARGGDRLNDLLARHRDTATSVEVVVEPPARVEVVAQQLAGTPPADLPGSHLPLFRSRAADPDVDVIVLSLAGDLTRSLYRDVASGFAIDPGTLGDDFDPAHARAVEGSFRRAAEKVAERVKALSGAHVIWFTASTVAPHEREHRWTGRRPPFSVRANRLDLEVMRLSQRAGISLVDADRVVAEMGAAAHVKETLRYSDEASEALAAELLRVMTEIGFFDHRPLLMQVGAGDR
jgi:hypothetical protein